MSNKNQITRAVVIAVLVLIADQYTKHVVLQNLELGQTVPVIGGYFDLTLVFNKGAAFGFLANVEDGLRQILLALATCVALVSVLYFLYNDYRNDIGGQRAICLIVGGAAGNIIDRVRFGQVVDFLDFYYGTYHWPAFNIADSAICVGVTLLLCASLFKKQHPVVTATSAT